MLTDTEPRLVESGRLCAFTGALEKLLPKMEMIDPGDTGVFGVKPAAFTTPFDEIAGRIAGNAYFTTKASAGPPPGVDWKVPLLVGKSLELVKPTRYAEPPWSSAMAATLSSASPPINEEY